VAAAEFAVFDLVPFRAQHVAEAAILR
jgi:hypothetical protein